MKNFLLLLFLVQQGFATQPLQALPAPTDGISSSAISDPNAALHQKILQNVFSKQAPMITGSGPHYTHVTTFSHMGKQYQVQAQYHLTPIEPSSPPSFHPGVGLQPALPMSDSDTELQAIRAKHQQEIEAYQQRKNSAAQTFPLGNQCLSKKDIQEAQTAWSGFMEAAVGSLCDGGCPK